MEKTINDFILELQSLSPELRELPVKIQAPNGIIFEPKIKILSDEGQTMYDKPTAMIICYD